MKFKIADIDNPKLLYAVLVGLAHLLPDLGKRRRIHPFIGDRTSVVIQMIVHAIAASVPAHSLIRQRPQMTEIIITEHADDAVQSLPGVESLRSICSVVIALHFLINRQHLPRFRADAAAVLPVTNQLALGRNDLLQQLYIIRCRAVFSQKRRVPFAPHADGDHVLVSAAILQRILPIPQKSFAVGPEVPGISVHRMFSTHLVPFLTGTQARLVMRKAPDDAIFIRELHIRRSRPVQREGAGPHRRPQIIAAKPQKQLEHTVIHRCIKAAEMLRAPGSEGRPLIIDKKASVSDRRLPGYAV